MEGVKEVRHLDDQRLGWRAEIAGKEKEWTAKIIEQIPDDASSGGPSPASTLQDR